MKIKFYIIVILVVILMINQVIFAVSDKNVYNNDGLNPAAKEMFSITLSKQETDTININGKDYHLYITFRDQVASFELLKKYYPEYLDEISNKYGLEKISDKNWEDYRLKSNRLVQSIIDNPESNDETIKKYSEAYDFLNAFFDIYENVNVNNNIINEYAKTVNVSASRENGYNDIIELLPREKRKSIHKRESAIVDSITVEVYYLNAARSYALEYATTPNSDEFGYMDGGDCTNFASQCAYAGGQTQTLSWMHWFLFGHHYTSDWSVANHFADYFDVTLTGITSYHDFAHCISIGDVALADFADDGSFDHAGFVTYKDTYEAWYGGKYYEDYAIAQHTSNYHAWASSSTNNWENIPDNGGSYGLVIFV